MASIANDKPTAAPKNAEFSNPLTIERHARKVVKVLRKFLSEHPDQVWQGDDGKQYPRIEAYQFVAACFGCSPIISDTQALYDAEQSEIGMHAAAYVIDAANRTVSAAEATCMRSEAEWVTSPSFQVRSMAQTRASGKALRNKFAYVMVMAGLQGTPAEEMTVTANRKHSDEPGPRGGEQCADCTNHVYKKRAKKTREAYGRALCIECEKSAFEKSEQEPAAKPETDESAKPAPFPCGPDCVNPEHEWHTPKPARSPQQVLTFDQIKPGPQPVVKLLDKAKDTPYAI
jgi:hypothetical protein